MKKCPKCSGEFSQKEYGKNFWCLSCHNAYGREYYARDIEKSAQRSKKQFDTFYCTVKGRATHLLNNAKSRARRSGTAFNLTKEWLTPKLEVGICEVTGIPLEIQINGGKGHRNNSFAPSIDKINQSEGYTEDNCRLVCWIYNRARGAFPDKDLLKMAKALTENT